MASKVYESEYRFCLIVWENEPVRSGELVRLANEQLGWKHSTTYTVIKRLAQRGIVKNENGIVTSLVSQQDVQKTEIDELMEKRFNNSIPSFIAAFSKREKISDEDLDTIQEMINRMRKGENI